MIPRPPTSTLFPYTTLFRPAPPHASVAPHAPTGRRSDQRGPRTTCRRGRRAGRRPTPHVADRKSTRLNSSHTVISYAVFCLKKKKKKKKKHNNKKTQRKCIK